MVKHNIYCYNANVVKGKQSVRFVNAIFFLCMLLNIRESDNHRMFGWKAPLRSSCSKALPGQGYLLLD